MEENVNKIQEDTHVTITVQREGQKNVFMRISRSTPLGKVVRKYCDQLGLESKAVRFTIDGSRIKDLHTADDLGLKDGDVLDAWSDQYGGGSTPNLCLLRQIGAFYESTFAFISGLSI